MQGTWIVLLPPLLVIVSVLLTRKMILSFLIGIIASALIVTDGSLYQALTLTANKLWVSTGLDVLTKPQNFFSSMNLLIFLFLIMLGILIALLSQTGAAQAYVSVVQKYVKNRTAAQVASLILSLFFFIDDYFSALTVGSVMRPLAQLYNVHPVKLAFLTTAMATPITIISPISSWVGEIVLQLKQIGIGPEGPQTIIAADPYFVFVSAIPYSIYALLLIVSTWYIVLRGISYGPMRKYDQAITSDNRQEIIQTNASLADFLLPLGILITGVFVMLLYTGDYFLFGGKNSFADAIKNASPQQALFAGGLISLVCSVIYFYAKKRISSQSLGDCFKKGFNLMFPSIVMLVCAWALGNILKNDLKTGSYIAALVSSFINLKLFPLVCFLCAGFIAWMIGSAWATIALMFPIIIDMIQKLMHLEHNTPLELVPLIIPIVGATLSGCVTGTQLSIISDNPIMSAASTGADHLEHVKTMAWYVIPVAVATACAFTFLGITSPIIGFSKSLLLALCLGLTLAIAFLELGQYFFGKPKGIS